MAPADDTRNLPTLAWEPEKVCPTCGKIFELEATVCPDDGASLELTRPDPPAAHADTPEPAPAADPLVGQLIREKWRVLKRLGAGSFGTVYKVEDIRGGWTEALKILHVDKLTGADAENARSRFLREARIMKRLGSESPHIVGLNTYEEDLGAGLIYFTMELVEGKSLADALRDEGPFTAERTVRLALQACDGLAAAHEGPDPVVHRDLKLENLMLTKDRTGAEIVKVLDFGIAKIAEKGHDSRLTTVGTLGTPGYAAPEQLRAQEVDGRTDLFAFGVILYALLTGRDPWLGLPASQPTHMIYELMVQSDRGEVRPMSDTGVEVPEELQAIVMRLLRRNPDERFASASELREALLQVDIVSQATRQGVAGRGRSRPAAALAGVLGLLLLTAAGLLRPWGRTLHLEAAVTHAQAGDLAAARLVAGGMEGRFSWGPIPGLPFRTPLGEGEVLDAVQSLRSAGVQVDASSEVDRLIREAARAQSRTRYFGGSGDDVRSYAERAAALDPESAEARSLLRKVAERMAWDADAALQDGSPDEARRLARECLAVVPDHPRCLEVGAAATS